MHELLDSRELARRLRLKPCTILEWVKRGWIPAIRPSAKVLRFDWDEVAKALKDRRIAR